MSSDDRGTAAAPGRASSDRGQPARRTRWRTPPSQLPELMDAPDCDPTALADALEVLARSSRMLGGDRLLRRQALRLLRGRRPGPIGILDVGAGGGDASASLARHLARRGWQPAVTMADLHAATLTICRERVRDLPHRTAFVRLDAATLPFRSGAYDLAVSSLTLHHLEDRDAGLLLSELARVSRWGWAVTDLRRSPLAYAAVRALSATAWRRHPFPKEDGPVSILRSFTPGEVRGLVRGEGLGLAAVEGRIVRWAARGAS